MSTLPAPVNPADEHGWIAHEDIVRFDVPAFLSDDYDPTYRPTRIDRGDGSFPFDGEAHDVAEHMIFTGAWKRCPICGSGIATGLRVHATCEQNRQAGAA